MVSFKLPRAEILVAIAWACACAGGLGALRARPQPMQLARLDRKPLRRRAGRPAAQAPFKLASRKTPRKGWLL